MTEPLGSPENPLTKRAPLDAVLLAQAVYRDDEPAQQAILANCDPYSVAIQLCGFLLATFHNFDVDIEDRFGIWLEQTRQEIGEGDE